MNAELYKQVYRMQTEDGRKWADIEFADGKFSHCKYVVSRVTSRGTLVLTPAQDKMFGDEYRKLGFEVVIQDY